MRSTSFGNTNIALLLLFLAGESAGDQSSSLGLPPIADVSIPGNRGLQTELGRQLFHDPILSNDGTMSCAGIVKLTKTG